MAQSRDLIVRILADTSKLTAGMGEAEMETIAKHLSDRVTTFGG